MYAGLDWASEAHEACVVDDHGVIVRRIAIRHSERGICHLIAQLAELASPEQLPVAIERPDGVLVDRLLAAGHPVVPIHPNAFAAARPRWSAAPAKSDPGDAYRLADMLRTDHARLRTLRPLSQETRALQALVRLRDDHVATRIAATNQLAALLDLHWPGAKRIFARLDSEIALAFLDRYPTPQSAEQLGPARLAGFLKRYSYSGRRSPAVLLERLTDAPLVPAPITEHVLTDLVHSQVRIIRTVLGTINDLDRAIDAALREHTKTAILAPLPRIGTISLGQVIAEVGPILDRTSTVESAAAETGTAPITKTSGHHRAVVFRHHTNTRARKALTIWADNSRHQSTWAQNIYTKARARGCRHPHAIHILARAWLRVIWACWHTNTTYDPARRRGHDRHLESPSLT